MNGSRLPSKKGFGYGQLIVVCGMLAIIAGLGFGRFSLGMQLPSMGKDLQLGYDRMGFISTSNFIGYLCGVLISSRLVHRFGYRVVISSGILLVGATLILMGHTRNFGGALIAFFLTGIGSGATNVPVMTLISHWFYSSLRGRAAGFVVSGSGLGIMATGLLIPAVNAFSGDSGWRLTWQILGLMSLFIGGLCFLFLRNRPEEIGNQPAGTDTLGEGHGDHRSKVVENPVAILTRFGAIYFLFGFTYVIYVTFVVTTLMDQFFLPEITAGKFWFWFGLFGTFSGPLFGSLSDRIGRRKTMALVFLLQTTAHVLLATAPSLNAIYLSVFLFGICAWSIPSIMAAAVGDALGPFRSAAAFGTITLFFSIGQISGPTLAGLLAESSGSFQASYLAAACLTCSAAILCVTGRSSSK